MQSYNIPDQRKGDTFKGLSFEVIVNNVAKNLTSTEIKIEFRRDAKTGPQAKVLTVGNGITVTDALAGKFAIDAFVVTMGAGVYYYDVQFIDAGVVKTYIEGSWTIVQDVTG